VRAGDQAEGPGAGREARGILSGRTKSGAVTFGIRIAPRSRPTGSPLGGQRGVCEAGLGVPKPDIGKALRGGRARLPAEPTSRDRRRSSLRTQPAVPCTRLVTPPTDARAFAEWMVRCGTQCAVFPRLSAGGRAIRPCLYPEPDRSAAVSEHYMGYYAEQPYAGPGYMTEGLRFGTAAHLHDHEAAPSRGEHQPENVASIALVKSAGFRLEASRRAI